MVSKPKLYADFQNADAQGRVRLNAVGTIDDLARQQVLLKNGLTVDLYSDDADDQGQPQSLVAAGTVEFSPDEQCWVASIEWDNIHAEPLSSSPAVAIAGEFGSPNVLPETRSAR